MASTTFKGSYHPFQYAKKQCLPEILPLLPCAAAGIKPAKEKDIQSLFHFLDESSWMWYEQVLTKAPQLQNDNTEDERRDNSEENEVI